MALLALGVVYGDIGTSPLYALRECLSHGRFEVGNELTVLGPVSLMIWSLTIIVTVKYLLFLSKADNQGEGGIFALYSLLRQSKAGLSKRSISVLGIIVLLGAALLYGDGIITPAISVLSAVEGLEQVHPGTATLGRARGGIRHFAGTFHGAALWHEEDWRDFWSHHGRLVQHAGSAWRDPSGQRHQYFAGVFPPLRGDVPHL